MAISKRLRFEILKRDGFACRYCHRDKVIITVDHVIPRVLGGTDDPSNLVASCDDCNAGKSSTLPGGATVAEPGGADDSTLVERITAEFNRAWGDPHSRPDAEALRILKAHAIAAHAAGYEEIAIAAAAHDGGRSCVPHLGDILSTVDSVFLLESETSPDNPYGPNGIDRDLLPSQIDRDAEAVADAAVAVWRAAWQAEAKHSPGAPVPGRDSGASHAFHAWAADAYRETEEAAPVLDGAQWAGSERSDNLAAAIERAEGHRATEPAVSAWGLAWRTATGSLPASDVEQEFWQDCYALRAHGVWDHYILAAAVFAGAHATARMHFTLSDDEAQVIGVHGPTQHAEDLWARAWASSSGSWPTEEDREAFRASLSSVGRRGVNITADVDAAAICAGAYQSRDVLPGLPKSLSAIEFAAPPVRVGGE